MLVAVTGANGFVGNHLVNHLNEKGFKVKPIIRDNKNNNLDPDTEWKNTLEGVEILIHCASRVHIMKENIKNSMAIYRKINVEGTRKLATQAIEIGVKK